MVGMDPFLYSSALHVNQFLCSLPKYPQQVISAWLFQLKVPRGALTSKPLLSERVHEIPRTY